MLLLLLACMSRQIVALQQENEVLRAENAELREALAQQYATAAPSTQEAEAEVLIQQASDLLLEMKYAEARTILTRIAQDYGSTRVASTARKLLPELKIIGTPAPALTDVRWITGTGPAIGNTLTVVVFWEAWCPYCKQNLPILNRLVDRLKDQGVALTSYTRLSRGKTDADVKNYLQENQFTFPTGHDANGKLSVAFAVSGIPAAAVIRDGIIIWRGHPAKLDDVTLETLMKMPTPAAP